MVLSAVCSCGQPQLGIGEAGTAMSRARSPASLASRSARKRTIFAASAARVIRRGQLPRPIALLLQTVLGRPADLAYLRPFRPTGRSRPPTAAPSRTASASGGVGETAAMRFGFACFGFFASRLDRRFSVAIVGSFCPESIRGRRTSAHGRTRPFPARLGASHRRNRAQ
jgi:hypothetical protein